jgi:dolichyl-phosphate-mannose--protein O-mannosyl transferase
VSTLARRLNRPVVALVAVGVIAAVLRFWHLGYPQTRIFDEYYYAKSACIFLGYSNARCDINSDDERYWRREQNDIGAWVHPPLGKWAIAAGELAFGTESFGWRVAAAAAGTASVVLVAGIAQLLWGNAIWTFVAGLLLATESLNFVQSRTAMLDIFVAFWIVLALLLLLLDRRWIERRTPEPTEPTEPTEPDAAPVETAPPAPGAEPAGPSPVPASAPEPLWRPWRFATGVALGAAVATKWSGLTAIAAVIVLSLMWEVTRRRRAGVRKAVWRTVQAEGFPLVLAFLLTPALVYIASYLAWFLENGWDFMKWTRLQSSIARYHSSLKVVDMAGRPIHPYLSEAWKWILLWRPVLYYAHYPVEGLRKVIYANGNPAVFWGAILAIPYTLVAWRRKRDWRAGYVAVAVLAMYLPWFFISRPQFLFYATPLTPFFVLAVVYVLKDLSEYRYRIPGEEQGSVAALTRSRPFLPFTVGFIVASVLLFVWFFPTLTGGALSDAAYRLRNWFPTWT